MLSRGGPRIAFFTPFGPTMTHPERIRGLARAAALALGLSTAALPAASDDLVIGQVAGQSGPFADATRDFVAGARTCFDHANATGGIHGRRINLRIRDDGGDPARTAELTREALESDRAEVLFGFFGDANVRAAVRSDAYLRSGVALVGAVSGLDPGPGAANVFFTRASYEGEIRRVIEQFQGMGLRRIGFAFAAIDSSRAVAAKAAEIAAKAGLDHAASVEIPVVDTAPLQAARQMNAAAPHVVIVIADTITTAGFIKAFRETGAATFLVGLSLVNHTTVMELLGPKLAVGTLITQIVPDPRKSDLAIAGEHNRLMAKYRDEPPSHLTLEGFLAAKTLVTALRKARKGASRAEIAAAIRSLEQADMGGITIAFSAQPRGYNFVDIAFLRRNGTLLR
jgi:ABC-type branched-subunit amino acid transport system substrate-binding protein